MRGPLVRFLGRFAHLYESGVPLAEALDLVGREQSAPLDALCRQIVEDLYRGTSLADAFERHPEYFGSSAVGILRSGEQRGELGEALRSIAAGLSRGVLDASALPPESLDEFFAATAETRVLELDLGDPVAVALLELAGQRGGFVREARLVRVASSGATVVVRFSGAPGAEPGAAKEWREAPPSLLCLVIGAATDGVAILRAVLAASAGRKVAVGLPEIPEALYASDLDHAISLAPDILCLESLCTTVERDQLLYAVDCGVRVVTAAPSARLLDGHAARITPIA